MKPTIKTKQHPDWTWKAKVLVPKIVWNQAYETPGFYDDTAKRNAMIWIDENWKGAEI